MDWTAAVWGGVLTELAGRVHAAEHNSVSTVGHGAGMGRVCQHKPYSRGVLAEYQSLDGHIMCT